MATSEDNLLIVVPTYNEKENIEPLVQGVFSSLTNPHILFVDDGSPDGTADMVEETMKKNLGIHLIRRTRKMGLGTAYVQGFSFFLEKGYDLVFEMDADLSHDPCDLPRFVKASKEFDLVIGSRYIPGGGTRNWGRVRRAVSVLGNAYSRTILGCPFSDLTSGFRCYRRRALESIDLKDIHSEGYAFQIEMAYRIWKKGLRIGEIPIIFSERKGGRSKMSPGIFIEAIFGVWRMKLTI